MSKDKRFNKYTMYLEHPFLTFMDYSFIERAIPNIGVILYKDLFSFSPKYIDNMITNSLFHGFMIGDDGQILNV
jgi:hypothetical protein